LTEILSNSIYRVLILTVLVNKWDNMIVKYYTQLLYFMTNLPHSKLLF